MFDLNEKKFAGSTIFNNGAAGLAKGVEISVEKRTNDEPDTYPIYKLIATDSSGAKVNQGFYYFKPDPQKSDEQNQKSEVLQVGRVVHAAKAVMGADYSFPKVESSKEAYDVLFKLIKDNAGAKKYNIFVNYGTKGYPKKYLTLRFFDFLEAEDASNPRVSVTKPDDLLERVEQDAPQGGGFDAPKAKKSENWI